jgi:N-acetylneuraminic acid mutarotase
LVGDATSKNVPTEDQLLDCITNHATQYLCQDLGPLIMEYVRFSGLEIFTPYCAMLFDDKIQSWIRRAQRYKFFPGAFAKMEGKVYYVGGHDSIPEKKVDCFDDTMDQWTTVAFMHTPRTYLSVAILNKKLYIIGGWNNQDGIALTRVEYYDPTLNQCVTVSPMTTARFGHSIGVLKGKIYAMGGSMGGSDGHNTLCSVECYDEVTNQWTQVASMNIRRYQRYGQTVGVLNGKLYAVGGFDGKDWVSSVECYDEAINQWTLVAPMTTPRAGHNVCVSHGQLYAVGGETSENVILNSVECYDPGSNTWTLVPELSLDNQVNETSI